MRSVWVGAKRLGLTGVLLLGGFIADFPAAVAQRPTSRRTIAQSANFQGNNRQEAPIVDGEEIPPKPIPQSSPARSEMRGNQPGQRAIEPAGNGLALEDFEQLALQYHPTIAESAARVEAARGQWVQAGLLPNPIVGYSGQQVGSRGQAEQDGVLVQGDLILGGKLRRGRAVAEQAIQRAEMELAAHQLRVLTIVRKSYYDALVAQQRREFSDKLVDIEARGVEVTESLFRVKEAARSDVLLARIELDHAKILQSNARNRVTAAWRTLAASTGVANLPSQQLMGSLDATSREYEWEAMVDRLLGSSPELAAAIAESARARAAVDRARADAIPDLTIQGLVQRDASLDATNGGLQVTMPIPLFNRNQGNIRSAYSEWTAAEQAVLRMENELQSRLAPVFERYSNAREQVEKYENEILPNATETLDLAQAAFQAGEAGYLNLLTAQRTYFQMHFAHLDALRDLWLAIWDMEGLLLDQEDGGP